MRLLLTVLSFLGGINAAYATSAVSNAQLDRGVAAIQSRTGCFVVDYSFVETQSLKPGYEQDHRVYDPNRNKTVKEWIYSEQLSPTRVWLQHVLFMTDTAGNLMTNSLLKHTGEDWRYNADSLYDFVGPFTWNVVKPAATGLWMRAITNLDDGPRYQCAAAFDLSTASPLWTCDDYAPIPGREYRDFKRADYNTLQRSTKLVNYSPNWVEQENNVKTIDTAGVRTPLAREMGKTWYVKVDDSECVAAKEYLKPRLAFWQLLRQTWDEVLDGKTTFVEKSIPGGNRASDIFDLEDTYLSQDLSAPAIHESAHQDILKTIAKYRK